MYEVRAGHRLGHDQLLLCCVRGWPDPDDPEPPGQPPHAVVGGVYRGGDPRWGGRRGADGVEPRQHVCRVKRCMGRDYADVAVQEWMESVPFRVVASNGNVRIRVKSHGADRDLAPEEVSAMLLAQMKADAEDTLGTGVADAVITVPAYFNNAQRQATKDAGSIAGLNVLKLLNEPTAAAIAYGVEKKRSDEQKVLVFDMGGGTFDVAVLSVSGSGINVCSVAGDCCLGGADVDQRLVDYCRDQFYAEHQKDFSPDKRAGARLRCIGELVKKKLSTVLQASARIDSLYQGEDLDVPVSRAKLELLCKDLFEKTKVSMDCALADANVSRHGIDSVLMVGGSTRIPYIRQMVTRYFEHPPNHTLNPDEAVAHGAAIEAWRLTSTCDKMKALTLQDVAPLSLGTDIVGDEMVVLVPKNTPIPACYSATFNNYSDFQTSMEFKVFEGERLQAHANHLLAKFTLDDIAPQPKGKSAIKATFEIDANGILVVTASDLTTGKSNSISGVTSSLSRQEVRRMIEEGEKHRTLDQAFQRQREARTVFQDYLDALDAIAHASTTTVAKKTTARLSLEQGRAWLAANQEASELAIIDRLDRLKGSTQFA